MRSVLKTAKMLLGRRESREWLIEVAGITLISAAAFTIAPAVALVVTGIYLLIVANTGGG